MDNARVIGQYQINYILTKCRYWNSLANSKAYLGADIDSDHNLVAANLRIKLKKVLKAKRRWRCFFGFW